jgi:UDP-glucose 4-epimerase
MSKCLVTGGAGFIGSHIVRALLERGRQVRVLDNLSTGKRANLAEIAGQIELLEGDICDVPTVERAMRDVDVVFHLAARASVPRSVEHPRPANEINVTGTLNLLIAARDAGARRFVYSASSSAYGDTPTMPKIETMRPAPLSPYAVSKLAAEHYCACWSHVYGLQTACLRYFNVFGPRQDPKGDYAAVIPAFVSRMLRGERPIIFGDGEQSRDFCFVANVVHANLLASEAPEVHGEVMNIACGQSTTLNQIVADINKLLGTNLAPEYREPRRGDVRHSLAALDAAKRVIGYEPQVFFSDGLRRSIEWYKANLA